MHTPALQFSYHSDRLFSISTRKEIRASRSRVLDLKPPIPFSGPKFVRDSSWKRSNVGFGRSPFGGFASMAFSGGNGGFGKSDGNSGGKGDGEDGNGSNLVGSWFFWGKKWEDALLVGLWESMRRACSLYASTWAVDLCQEFKAFVDFFDPVIWIVLLCTLVLGILMAAALCAYIFFYFLKRELRGPEENASGPTEENEENASGPTEENASSPPDDVECCICLSTYEGTPIWRPLPCNHWFHSSCVDSWLQINPSCPLCKRRCL